MLFRFLLPWLFFEVYESILCELCFSSAAFTENLGFYWIQSVLLSEFWVSVFVFCTPAWGWMLFYAFYNFSLGNITWNLFLHGLRTADLKKLESYWIWNKFTYGQIALSSGCFHLRKLLTGGCVFLLKEVLDLKCTSACELSTSTSPGCLLDCVSLCHTHRSFHVII